MATSSKKIQHSQRASKSQKTPDSHPALQGEKLTLVSVSATDTIEHALRLMKRNDLSDLLVMETTTEPQRLLGIISDREIAMSLLDNPMVRTRLVTELMTESKITASEGDDFFQMVRRMEEFGLSRLPITNTEGRVVSIVTTKDLLQLLVRSLIDVQNDPKSKAEVERVQH